MKDNKDRNTTWEGRNTTWMELRSAKEESN
jgi:hypothetical protein